MGAIVVGIVGAIFGASFDDPPPAVNIAATVVQDGAFIGAALLFAGARRARAAGAVRARAHARSGRRSAGCSLAYVVYVGLGRAVGR